MYQIEQHRTPSATSKNWKQNIYARLAVAFSISMGLCALTLLACYLAKSILYGRFIPVAHLSYVQFIDGWETTDRIQWTVCGGSLAVFVLYTIFELARYIARKPA